jgi:hypothetical protein
MPGAAVLTPTNLLDLQISVTMVPLTLSQSEKDRLVKFSRTIAALALAVLLAACASGATPGGMTAHVSDATRITDRSALRGAVAIGEVGGGRETNPSRWLAPSNPDFASALRRSLSAHTMLAIEGEAFRLHATILELSSHYGGMHLTAESRISYRLVRVADGAVVFSREVRTLFTAPPFSQSLGVDRSWLLTEGAVRKNIGQFLAALVAEERGNPGGFRAGDPRIS